MFRNRKEFTGSLFTQLTDVYKLIDFYNGTKANFHDFIRTDEKDYSEDAIREALVNAIVHRDYSFSGSLFINLYLDILENISLGGLVSGLSLEAAMLRASQSRNEKLAALFYKLKLIEAYGTDIGKIISSYNKTGVKPIFENVEGAFRVTLAESNKVKNSFEYSIRLHHQSSLSALVSNQHGAVNISRALIFFSLLFFLQVY